MNPDQRPCLGAPARAHLERWTFTLNAAQLVRAIQLVKRWQDESWRLVGGRVGYDLDRAKKWAYSIHGACSELALHLLTGETWHSAEINRFGGSDVGPWHVRAPTYVPAILKLQAPGPNGEPCAQNPDRPGIYVLAESRSDMGPWRFCGWAEMPSCLSRAKWAPLRPDRPCWWLYQDALMPMDQLPGLRLADQLQ